MRVPSTSSPLPSPSCNISNILQQADTLQGVDNSRTLPSISKLMQDVHLQDQSRRRSTCSDSTEEDEDDQGSVRLPPLNLSKRQAHQSVARRPDQIGSHIGQRYEPYPSSPSRTPSPSAIMSTHDQAVPVLRKGRRASRGVATNQKALKEADARHQQAVEFAGLSRALRTVNPSLEAQWTPLKTNNVTDDVEDPLKHNKLDVLGSASNTIIHQHMLIDEAIRYLEDRGLYEQAGSLRQQRSKIGFNV